MLAINYNIFKEFGNLNMDKEQSYFVEDFGHSFQTLSVHFKQSLDDLAKQFSGKNLSEQISSTIDTIFNKNEPIGLTQMQKTTVANQNNIDGLINNRSLETMNKSIKEDIAVSNSVINNRSLDTLKEQKYDMAESISASLAATQHKL